MIQFLDSMSFWDWYFVGLVIGILGIWIAQVCDKAFWSTEGAPFAVFMTITPVFNLFVLVFGALVAVVASIAFVFALPTMLLNRKTK